MLLSYHAGQSVWTSTNASIMSGSCGAALLRGGCFTAGLLWLGRVTMSRVGAPGGAQEGVSGGVGERQSELSYVLCLQAVQADRKQ